MHVSPHGVESGTPLFRRVDGLSAAPVSGAVQRVQGKGSLIREGALPAHTLDATGGMLGMALCNLPTRYPWEREGTGGPHAGCTDDEGKGIKGKVGEGGRAGGKIYAVAG